MERKIIYVEPIDYFPKEIREKCLLFFTADLSPRFMSGTAAECFILRTQSSEMSWMLSTRQLIFDDRV